MYRIIPLLGIFCLFTACLPYTLPPPPPPMSFMVAWAPEQAPELFSSNTEMVLQALDTCNSGGFTGKNMKDGIFPGLTFFSKALEDKKTLQAGKVYFLRYFDNGTENTTAVMFNLTADKKGEILDCLAEKVVYRSK